MYKLLTSKGQLFAIALGIISVAIAVGSIISGVKSQYSMSDDLVDIMKSNPDATFDFINPAISIVLVLMVLALAAAVIFGLIGLLSDPKGSMKFLIGLALVVLIFFVLYSTSSGESTGRLAMLTQKFNVNDGVLKLISGGVKTAVWGIAIAFFVAIIMEIINFFK